MGKICRHCGYERKPTDDAPDWACPECEYAYTKSDVEAGKNKNIEQSAKGKEKETNVSSHQQNSSPQEINKLGKITHKLKWSIPLLLLISIAIYYLISLVSR